MSQTITVVGLASLTIVKVIPVPDVIAPELSLMEFLISNGITIASSCGGVGSCHKCLINRTLLSCQTTLLEFIDTTPTKRVEIPYL